MLGRQFLLFTLVPLVELWLLVQIGEVVGLPATLAAVVMTGALGASLAKREGLRTLHAWQESLARGQLPEEGLASGLLILVGGIFLVTPGVLTDVIGLSMLLPPLRRAAAWGLLALLIAVYPANIHMLVNDVYLPDMPRERWLL